MKDPGDFHRVSYTYKVPRGVLYHTNGPDLMCVGPRFSRRSEAQHDGAPYGAVVQWPPYRAGLYSLLSFHWLAIHVIPLCTTSMPPFHFEFEVMGIMIPRKADLQP